MSDFVLSPMGAYIHLTVERWAHTKNKGASMALKDLTEYLSMAPVVNLFPTANLWSSYDEEADVLYIRFDRSLPVTDSELTDDDIILRYYGDDVVGITVLHTSQR